MLRLEKLEQLGVQILEQVQQEQLEEPLFLLLNWELKQYLQLQILLKVHL